ncbi:hypothetical protein [Methylotenera sp.]|uniref:hypothetical protein n=1 Tax=Methylotenera sp. TaxID=2051956 RepID=UPI0024878D83|nr:hypothetical protein [Methylotenera sp.]MDI1360643.1 hypothetical protein [Methylotenera sp.]
MENIELKLVDKRECARGYSVGLFHSSKEAIENAFTVVLFLDNVPYWGYEKLNEYDARNALEDLEILPGPRGDSSWKAVLARCMLKPPINNPPKEFPKVMTTKRTSGVGTWEWLNNLHNLKII